MSMRKLARAALAAALVWALLASCTVTGSAKLFKPGDAETLSEALGAGPYKVVVEHIDAFEFRLFGFDLSNGIWGKGGPIREIVIDEDAAESAVVLSGGARTLAHLALTVDEDAQEIRVSLPRCVFWLFENSSVSIAVGAPVESLEVDASGRIDVSYEGIGLDEFRLRTDGPVIGTYSFAGPAQKLDLNIRELGKATVTGESVENVVYKASAGFIDAYDLPAKNADITCFSAAFVKQYFQREGKLIARINSGSEVWYDYLRFDDDADPAHENPLPAPDVSQVYLAENGRLVKYFWVDT